MSCADGNPKQTYVEEGKVMDWPCPNCHAEAHEYGAHYFHNRILKNFICDCGCRFDVEFGAPEIKNIETVQPSEVES